MAMLTYHFPSRASEWATTAILFLWGLISYQQGEASIVNLSSLWPIIFMTLAGIRCAILIINGALRHSPHLRSILSFLCCFAWFQISLSFFTLDFISTGLAVYPILLALDFYNAYRIAVAARIADEGHKRNAGCDS